MCLLYARSRIPKVGMRTMTYVTRLRKSSSMVEGTEAEGSGVRSPEKVKVER